MNSFLEKLYPADIIAVVVIIGGFVLIYNHINTVTGTLVSAAVFYYFGKQRRNHVV